MNDYPILKDWYMEKREEISDEMSYKFKWDENTLFLLNQVKDLYKKYLYKFLEKKGLKKYGITKKYVKNTREVINTHVSKSIECPVVRLSLRECLGLSVIMRFNFFNWKLSVVSDIKLDDLNFYSLFDKDEKIDPNSCEGMMNELVFDSYSENKKRFTVKLKDKYEVYMFLKIIIDYLIKLDYGEVGK